MMKNTGITPILILLAAILCDCGFAADTENTKRSTDKFQRLCDAEWKEVFFDDCTKDWRESWTLDGRKAEITNGKNGMDFQAGPVRKENASHAVLWTKASFRGDLRLDYEYTKLDDAVEAVTILYLQATGSGADGYDKDISRWSDKREVASMSQYFNHMHLHHISYAAFPVGNTDPKQDYIRARRYMPETQDGLTNTDLKPDYFETGLFQKDVPHKITVIKFRDDLFMHIRNQDKQQLCHWKTDTLPPVVEGRIGLRHMWTRAARYRNFRISQPMKHSDGHNTAFCLTTERRNDETAIILWPVFGRTCPRGHARDRR
jgi:hypothetical protein